MLTRQVRAVAFAILIVAPVLAFARARASPAQVPSAVGRAEVRAAAAADRRRVRRRVPAADDAQPEQAGSGADEGARRTRPSPSSSQPMLRLAGSRVNPKTNGPHRAIGLAGTGIYSITLKKIADGAEVNVTMPPQARISHVKFSPDGSRLAFLHTKDSAIELWVADGATGSRKGGRHRRGSHQRDDRRSLRLAARQRDDGVRARPRGPRAGAGRSRRCRSGRTSTRATARPRRRRPTRICSRTRTTTRCSTTTSRASSPPSTPAPARRRRSAGRRSSAT